MELRSETVLLLGLCGVDCKHLVFLDDQEAAGLLRRAGAVVLVDHNRADGPLVPLGDKVVEILDHHKDLGDHCHVQGERRMIAFDGALATAASCCTIIAERFFAHPQGRKLLAQDTGAAARALQGVILIDSINLDPAAKKACARDIAAAAELEKLSPAPAQAELFEKLNSAKFDIDFWASMKTGQCLRYDFKRFESSGRSCGISSVLCPLAMLMAKEGWSEGALAYLSEADIFAVLTMSKSGDAIRRQLLLVARDDTTGAKVAEFLASYEGGLLQLEPICKEELAGPPGVKAFEQRNTAASRKQVAPAFLAFFDSVASLSGSL